MTELVFYQLLSAIFYICASVLYYRQIAAAELAEAKSSREQVAVTRALLLCAAALWPLTIGFFYLVDKSVK